MSQMIVDTQLPTQQFNDYNHHHNFQTQNQRNKNLISQENIIKKLRNEQNMNHETQQDISKKENWQQFYYQPHFVQQQNQMKKENYHQSFDKMFNNQNHEYIQKQIKDQSDKRQQQQINTLSKQNLFEIDQNNNPIINSLSEVLDKDLQIQLKQNQHKFQQQSQNEFTNLNKDSLDIYSYETATSFKSKPPQKSFLTNLNFETKQQIYNEQELQQLYSANKVLNSYRNPEMIQKQIQQANSSSLTSVSTIESSYSQQQISDPTVLSLSQIGKEIFQKINSFNIYYLHVEYDDIMRQIFIQKNKKSDFEQFIEEYQNILQSIPNPTEFFLLLMQDLKLMKRLIYECDKKILDLTYESKNIKEKIDQFNYRQKKLNEDNNHQINFRNTFEREPIFKQAINAQNNSVLCNDAKIEFEPLIQTQQPLQQSDQKQISSQQHIPVQQVTQIQSTQQQLISQEQQQIPQQQLIIQQKQQQFQQQIQQQQQKNEIYQNKSQNQLKPIILQLQQNINNEIEDEKRKQYTQLQGNNQTPTSDQLSSLHNNIIIKKEADQSQNLQSNILEQNLMQTRVQQSQHTTRDYYSLITQENILEETEEAKQKQIQAAYHLQQIQPLESELPCMNIIKQEYLQSKQNPQSTEQNREIIQIKNEHEEQIISNQINQQMQNQIEQKSKDDIRLDEECLENMRDSGFYLVQNQQKHEKVQNENEILQNIRRDSLLNYAQMERYNQYNVQCTQIPQNMQQNVYDEYNISYQKYTQIQDTEKNSKLKVVKKIKKEKPLTDLADSIRFRTNEKKSHHYTEEQLEKKKQFHNQFKIFMLQCTKYIIKYIISNPTIHNNQLDKIEYHKRYLQAFKNRFTKSDICYFMKKVEQIKSEEILELMKLENPKNQQIQQRKFILLLIIIGSFLNKEEMDNIIPNNHPNYEQFFDQGSTKLSEYLLENPDKIQLINNYIDIICEFNRINRMVSYLFCYYEIGSQACKKKASKLDQFYCKNYILNILSNPSIIE